MDDGLRYDYTFMMAEVVGEHGVTEAELVELMPRLEASRQDFLDDKDNNRLGFAVLPYDEGTVLAAQSMASQIKQDFDTLVVLGVGGSDLGGRALQMALNHAYYNQLPNQTAKLYFAGNNTDPKELADLLDVLDLSKTAVVVVSKSGDTIETMAAFVLFRDRLIQAVGPEVAKRHIIALTDAQEGALRAIARREGYRSLAVPADVGGRFSVLSVVGLLPAAFAGIQVEELAEGARAMDELVVAAAVKDNPPLMFAALQYLANTKHRQVMSVLMPYGEELRGVAQWYRQLWAESLGKRLDSQGRVVNVGPTPIAAVGATDQHSQMQLYNEGPFDKVVTFVEIEESSRSLAIGQEFGGVEELAYLRGLEFGELLSTERLASAMSLAKNGRPNGTIFLPKLEEYCLGQLLYFLEAAVVYSGSLYQINAYDQPGVEAGKQAMYALLGRPGYEQQAEGWKRWRRPDKTFEVG